MAWIFKRPGRSMWYIAYYVQTETGRKKIIRGSGTDDHTTAMSRAAEIGETQRGQGKEEHVKKILVEAGAKIDVQLHHAIKDLWESYQKQPITRTIEERTLASKKTHIKIFLEWIEKNHPEIKYIDEITERTAAEFMTSIAGKSGVTRNNYLSTLHSVFVTIRIPLGLKLNVWEAVPRVEQKSIRKQALNIEQIQALYKHAQEFKSRYPEFWPIAISMAYHTGMRLGDVCTLTWEELHFKEKMLNYIPNKGKKKGNMISYPVGAWAAPLRKLWTGQTEGPVWEKLNREYETRSAYITDEFNEICKLAEIETTREKKKGEIRERLVKLVGFHSLRHSHVTMALDAGATLADVQKTVGHGSPFMTEHYNHSLAAGKRVAEKLPGLKKK